MVMQRQCRICFGEGDEATMLTPCACRGTSAYIHAACLEAYVRHYPDRICRVCRTAFTPFRTMREAYFLGGILAGVCVLLLMSSVRILLKLALLGAASVLVGYVFQQNLLTTTPVVFLGILVGLFLPGGEVTAVYIWMVILGAIAFAYTLVLYIPMPYLLGIIVAMFVFAYMALLTVAAYAQLDTSAFAVYISVLYLAWYGWLHRHPPARLRLQ